MIRKFIIFFALVLIPFASLDASLAVSEKKVKILLVPGHDENIWGAQYGNVKEANMNLAVALRTFAILKKDPRFEVWITRDDSGYTKEFSKYLEKKEEINSFKNQAKKEMKNLIETGAFVPKKSVPHNAASADTALILYGINKWANENHMDAVVHIHFNDEARKNKWVLGKYEGFAVYVPEDQMVNSKESQVLGQTFFNELGEKYNTSSNPLEKGGFIKGQKLIALGANGTLAPSVRSILIEYAYIYEKKLLSDNSRHKVYDDMATIIASALKKHAW